MTKARFMPIVFGQDGQVKPNTNPRSSGAQDFYALQKHCLANGNLFEDPEFSASTTSLTFDGESRPEVEWLRPNVISKNPKFFVKRFSRFDIKQGQLNDCWLLAAAANLTQDPELFTRVVPVDNSFTDNYAGIFHFRFWRYGQWYDVVIDDRLPTIEGKLIYMRSTEDNEFWSALLEKAYAKLFGSYAALTGGLASDAMVDFTGGIVESYDLKNVCIDLFYIIVKGFQNRAMFVCTLKKDTTEQQAVTQTGLIRDHAYSLTMAKLMDIHTPNGKMKIPLLRLRNPWGNETEWNGAWSDKSPEWKFIPEETKREVGLTFEQDGEFWMSFQDFVRNFDYMEMCSLSPDCPIVCQRGEYPWRQSTFEGEWVIGNTAGGCSNNEDTFWRNPQYIVRLDDPDKDDIDSKATAIITLMQKNRRSKRNKGIHCLQIGFVIYKVSERDLLQGPLPKEFFKENNFKRNSTFSEVREVTCRFRLDTGTYVVIPSTVQPNSEGEFMIRVFSEHPDCISENERSVGECDLDPRIMKDVLNPTNPNQWQAAMERLFLDVAGEDFEVDSLELKMVLDLYFKDYIAETNGQGFSKDVCRSMVAMLDEDRSGKLGFAEFQKLLTDIDKWKEVFKLYDSKCTGHLNPFDLRAALHSAGYSLNNTILNSMMHRYGSGKGQIWFDDFISCAVKVKTMIEIFNAKDFNKTNVASFSMNEWIHTTIYC